jgi:pseudouridine synthase
MSNPERVAAPRRERLQKFLAACGVASRRACERIILAGRVRVDGTVVREIGVSIDPARQRVEVDGAVVRRAPFRYFMYHKPRGVLTALSDPSGRGTLGDVLPPEIGRVYHVGRLDRDSEGLLLLTNDGDFAMRLTHPRYGVEKTYQVWCVGDPTAEQRQRMTRGIVDDGERLRARRIERLGPGRYSVVLAEGKKREIRRLFAACGCRVTRLLRTAIGPVQLGALSTGRLRELTEEEIATLRNLSRAVAV